MPLDNVAHTLVSKYHVQSILESMEVCSAPSSLHQLNLITGDRPSHELKPLLCASSLSFFFFMFICACLCVSVSDIQQMEVSETLILCIELLQ